MDAQTYLLDGEVIQASFDALATRKIWVLRIKDFAARVVVVTNRRILVFRSGGVRTSKIKSLVSVLPRETAIGPLSGHRLSSWNRTESLGERLFIHSRYAEDVELSDRLGLQSQV